MSAKMTTPPSRIGPEKSILSSMLQDPAEYIPRAVELGVTPEKFYHPSHAVLFRHILDRINTGKAVELITISEDLLKSGDLDRIGGPGSLSEIYTYATTSAHFDDHVSQILDAAILRDLIITCTNAIIEANESVNAKESLAKCEVAILGISQESESRSSYDPSFKGGIKEVIDYLQSPDKPGMPLGIDQIDEMTGGAHRREITIIAARPSVGKTSLACSICANMAIRNNQSVAMFAVEGTKMALTGRIIAGETGVAAKRIRDKVIINGDIAKFTRLMNNHGDAKIQIDDRKATAPEIAARIRRMHQKAPLDVVLIDYIGKLSPSTTAERENPKLLISNATRIIADTCDSINAALIILAQLSRQKTDLDPQMHHLADSASLERDADVLIFAANKEGQPEDSGAIRQVLARVGKNRHGPIGDRDINFNPNTTKFY